MTLLPTQAGLVVCADKREWNRHEGSKESESKIFKLSATAGFAISGQVKLSVQIGRSSLASVYEVSKAVQDFYADPRRLQKISEYEDALRIFLKDSFEEAHRKYGWTIESTPGASDDVVFEVLLFYLKDRQIQVTQIQYHLNARITKDVLPWRGYVIGQTDVALRILKRRQYPDQRFSDLWNDPQIARVWNYGSPGYPNNVTLEDALHFSHLLIRESHRRHGLISDSPTLVGPTCDCALLNPEEGFRWLERNHDTRSPKSP